VKRKWQWQWITGWLVLTALVVATARRVDAAGTLRVLSGADPRWLVLAVLANAAILLPATGQWLLFLSRESRIGVKRVFGILAVTASVSNGGPPAAGILTQIHLLATRGGVGHAAAVSLTILDQIAEGLAKLAIVALAAAIVPGFEYRALGLLIVLGVPVLAAVFAVLAHRGHAVDRWAQASRGWVGRALRFLARIIHHLEALRRPAPFALAVVLGLVKKALEAAGIAAAAAALGIALPFWVVVAVLVAVNISYLIAPTPAALGVYEGAAFLVLRSAGLGADQALALALVGHAAYLLPLASTGWILESLRLGRGALLAAIAAVGLAVHAWFALGGDALDSDRALILLMARRFAQGDFSVFLWEQNYMGALEPLLITPLAAVGLATPVAAGFVGIALTAALAALSVGLARRLGGSAWMALLVWAVAPAMVVHHHVALYGARLAATLLAVAAFAWSLRAGSRGAWIAVGVLVGIPFFADHLMLLWAAAVVFVAARRGALRPLALGAVPVVALDMLVSALTPAVHLSGPNAPGHWLWNVVRLFGIALPQLFGFLLSRGPTPAFEVPSPVVPGGLLWLALAVPGAVALAALALTLVRHRGELFGRAAPDGGSAAQALLLACGVGLGLFAFVGGGGDLWSARYLVPLWPAVSVFAAVAVERWRPRLRPLAAALVLPAAFTLLADHSWPRAAEGAAARAEAAAAGEAVRASGARAVYAEYWDAYRMQLLTDAEVPWLTLRGIERNPDAARRALQASPVAYLIRHGHEEALSALADAPTQGIRTVAERDVGRFRFVVTERAVPGVSAPSEQGSRAWQITAALAAGLMFLGMLLVVGFLGGPPSRLRRVVEVVGRPAARRFPALLLANASVLWTWVAAAALGWAVQLGLGMGQPSQGLALSAAALPAALVAALPPRLRRWGMLAVVALTGVVGVANALHHRVFQTYLPLRALLAVDQGWSVRDYAVGLLQPVDLVPAAIVLLTLGGSLLAWRRERAGRPSPRARMALPLGLCLLGSVPALAWAWFVAPADADNQTGGFVYGHVIDACRIARDWAMPAEPTPEDMARILRATAADGMATSAGTTSPEGSNGSADGDREHDRWFGRAAEADVLMIQVEALNGWVLDTDVGGEPVAPFLRSLARRGLLFTNVFDETHLGRSSDADYLALVSQHPTDQDAVAMARPLQEVVALPGVLRDLGYATLAAHAHVPGFWNARVRRERYGFQEQLFGADLGPGESLRFGLVDGEMFRRMAPRLAALPRPWLGWLVTVTMHAPHSEVPSTFPHLPLGELEGTPVGNYLRKVRHTDDALRDLLAALDAAGILDETLVVVYGDHTEHRGLDKAWVERNAGVQGLPPDARHLLLDRVALVIVPPGDATSAGAGQIVATVGGLLDVAPTVLHLLGVERPRPFMGRSLLGAAPGLAAQASGEVVGDGLMWTGSGCYRFPEALPRPSEECGGIRARAREELEVSWLITRYALGPRLAGR
jgi:lipoteichoic acid synthase